jgi:putative ABC transport system permease protein
MRLGTLRGEVNNISMWSNNLKIAWRNITRRRLYSVVNISGMALGITAFALILQYVSLEHSVNRFHTKLPQLYRVLCQNPDGKSWPQVEPGWGVKAKEMFSEIQDFCRFAEEIGQGIVRNEAENLSFREQNICYGDGSFFGMFSFTLLQGNAAALYQPNVVFISKSYAAKYFGAENPIEKPLVLFNQFGKHYYAVGGVYEDMGENSDIRFDMVFAFETLNNIANLNGNDWAALNNLDAQFSSMFLLLKEGVDVAALEQKLNVMRRNLQPEKDAVSFRLQAFGETHLATNFSDNLHHTGNIRYVYMMTGIGLLIMLIAWFNYVNLNTVNALRRGKEVGVRKAVGAAQSTLIAQFLTETLLVNCLALAFALVLIAGLQPLFNDIIGKKLSLPVLLTTRTWLFGIGVLFVGSLLSGVFTAIVISGANPVETLRGKILKSANGLTLRQSLVITQFSISTILILFTVLVYSQLKHLQNKDLGINTEQLLVIRGPAIGRDNTYQLRKTAFGDELSAQSFVQDQCASGSVPGQGYNFATAGFTSPKSKPGDDEKSYNFSIIGHRFLDVYGLPLKTGRNFTAAECAVPWNDNSKILVNEKALASLGLTLDEALTTKITWDERDLDIVGVVKDYHHTSLQKPIEPILFYPQNSSEYFTVRLAAADLPGSIAALEKIYAKHFDGNPFEYFFTDDNFQKAYLSEQQYSWLFASAALWAIFIACLGLFGLSAFMIESRTKEIGIRKVLGASVAGITGLLAKDFLKLVVIAIVIASPIAYYGMNQWLSDFAYRVDIQWWMFAAAGALALLIAFLTVGFQSVKAALANPVKSLRSE